MENKLRRVALGHPPLSSIGFQDGGHTSTVWPPVYRPGANTAPIAESASRPSVYPVGPGSVQGRRR